LNVLARALVTALQIAFAAAPDKAARGAGDAWIDVSSYPAGQQARYALVAHKCSKCHSLSVAINARFTAADWKRYMREMGKRPGSGISAEQAKAILAFLEFYASRGGPQQSAEAR